MDRNNIIGIVLIFLIFIVWQAVMAPSKEQLAEQKRVQDSIAMVERAADSLAQLANPAEGAAPSEPIAETTTPDLPDSLVSLQLAQTFGVFAPSAKGEAEDIVLENEESIVTFSSKGGTIKSIELKHHFKVVKDEETREDVKIPLVLLEDEKNKFEYFLPIANLPAGGVSTADLYYEVNQPDNKTIVFTANAGSGRYLQQKYSLPEEGFLMDYEVKMEGLNNVLSAQDEIELTWLNYLDRIEKNTRIEKINSTLYFKELDERPAHIKFNGNGDRSTKGNPVKWVANSNQFFTTSLMAKEPFARAELESQTLDEENPDLKRMLSKIYLPFDRTDQSATYAIQIYSGPNEFKRLYKMGEGMEDVIPYGWNIFGTINRWIVRPVFAWLSTFIGSKGIVILFLTLIVKLALYPLTYRMLYSQSKMTALKPEIQKIKDRFKDDSQKVQMETMKLYREFGANPLGSCLPMVLQMPIWFALYRFFPAGIDFRQEGFLWATDLSSYDEFIQLPFEIPLGFGSHISLFTVLWAITTLLYTYYNSRHMDFSAQPAMKYMQYLMPVFFLGFFNSYASGLTAYLFFSNTVNIAQTLITKNYIINQDKIKAEMEAYRKKPKKKGGFQERLQKALDEQKKIQEKQKKGPNKKR
jgi:YidC/Oxa1 family membrane protein insertase